MIDILLIVIIFVIMMMIIILIICDDHDLDNHIDGENPIAMHILRRC